MSKVFLGECWPWLRHAAQGELLLGALYFLHCLLEPGSICSEPLSNQTLRGCLVCPADTAQPAGGETFSLAEMLIFKTACSLHSDSCVNHRGAAWWLSRSFGCHSSRTRTAPLGTRGWGSVIWRINIWDFVHCSRDNKTITTNTVSNFKDDSKAGKYKLLSSHNRCI